MHVVPCVHCVYCELGRYKTLPLWNNESLLMAWYRQTSLLQVSMLECGHLSVEIQLNTTTDCYHLHQLWQCPLTVCLLQQLFLWRPRWPVQCLKTITIKLQRVFNSATPVLPRSTTTTWRSQLMPSFAGSMLHIKVQTQHNHTLMSEQYCNQPSDGALRTPVSNDCYRIIPLFCCQSTCSSNITINVCVLTA